MLLKNSGQDNNLINFMPKTSCSVQVQQGGNSLNAKVVE